MTEKTVYIDDMPEAIRRFVLQWGDMGNQWGVNRSIAQIQALLYITERPMNADEIAETLGIARSNVSTSLRELQGWKLIRRVPLPGERKDHFEAVTDVWELATRIAAVRKEKEVDPALATLNQCIEEGQGDKRVSQEQLKRLENMREFTATMDRWYSQMITIPPNTLWKLVRMGDGVVGLLGFGKKKKGDRAA